MSRKSISKLRRTGRRVVLLLVGIAIGSALFIYGRWLYREQHYDQLINEVAAQHGLGDDYRFLVKAVIRRESKFDPSSRGKAGEIGLMQVTDLAAEDWAVGTGRENHRFEQIWDPRLNIEAGSWYLARALRRWDAADDPIPFALAEYNAGLGNVRRWLPPDRLPSATEFQSLIGYPTVRDYVATVIKYYEEYRREGQPPGD